MATLQRPSQETQVRFFIACPRSGSTLLMRIFAESPACAVTSRLVLMGNAALSQGGIIPDYSILNNPTQHPVFIEAANMGKRFLINKEELGNNSQKGEYLYDVQPSPSAYLSTRPIFLIRDPIRVFDSWKSVGWNDAQSLVDCYENMFMMLRRAPSLAVSCLIYERLVQEPHNEIKRICARWGVPYAEGMLDFKQAFGSSFFFSSERERKIYCEEKPLGLFKTVETSTCVESEVPCHGLCSNAEKDEIERRVGRLYLSCWNDDVTRLRTLLAERNWFGFDLDDTLHEFRRSSGKATDAILELISKRYETSLPALKAEFSRVVKEKTANAFSDGKTSFDYRRERITLLLAGLSLPQEDKYVEELLDIYEGVLMTSLELKCGVLELLSTLKDMSKRIVVITEGPQDAQERTVQRLGIGTYIDFLATTNHFQVQKTNGLFPRVLEHLCISGDDMAYIGDNELRDIQPAIREDRGGRVDEAISLHGQALKTFQSKLGDEHPDTLMAMEFLAAALYFHGSLQDALDLTKTVFSERQETLGSKHPSTIEIEGNLGVLHFRLGEYAEAELHQRSVLSLGREVLGNTHKITLEGMISLAATLAERGNLTEAVKLQREVYEESKNLSDVDSAYTEALARELSTMILELESRKEPFKLFSRIVGHYKRKLAS